MKLILLIFSVFLFSNVSLASSEVEIRVAPSNAPLIFADKTLVFDEPNENHEVYIQGPWSLMRLRAVNNSRETLVVASVTATSTNTVSDEIYSAEIFSGIYPRTVSGVVKPYLDANCDGSVSEVEANNPVAGNCELDSYDIFAGKLYIHSLLSGLAGPEVDSYRDAKFTVSLRFEGWFEVDGNPTRNFFKTVVFDLNAEQ